jgi:cell wall-associated NlpC family hydrolase
MADHECKQNQVINIGHWSDSYLMIPYVDGGRNAAVGLDCWGLVRDVLHQQFDLPLLKDFGLIHADDKVNMTRAYQQVKSAFLPGAPVAGAIAAGFNGSALIHVGVVLENNGLQVLHTSSKHGMSKCSIRRFNRLFSQVKYYVYNPK